ncbi:leucine-rich repeat domain-containing protein, partial [Isobaculum melis]
MLLGLIVLFVIGLKAMELLANSEVVSDLNIESEQQEILTDEAFSIKIKSANAEDKQVILPLPANVVYESSGVEHGSVVFDQENHQLMIDWYDTTTENRYVTVTMKIEEEGTYPFQAVSQRQEKGVQSQPIELTALSIVEEKQVIEEPPAEKDQTEVVPSNDSEESSELQSVPAEEVPVHKEEEQVPENKVLKTDARIGKPINEIFPDPEFAKFITNKVGGTDKKVTDPLTQREVDGVVELQIHYDRKIKSIDGIDIFDKLQSLYINNGLVTEIPENIGNLTLLTRFVFSRSKLTKLPKSIGDLTSLVTLELTDNQLESLPDSIGKLKQLQSLRVDENRLTSLPESVGNLSSLTMLDATKNKITHFPESLTNATSLIELKLYNNGISNIPYSIDNLKMLKKLDLTTNKITSLPETIGNLGSLEDLSLSSNQLKIIPETIGNLSSLVNLSMSDNQFTIIPDIIGNLSSLRSLSLDRNQFTVVPETIGNLSSLTILYLNSNQLTVLPDTIGNLSSLTYLYANSNQLTVLPDTIGNLSSLTYLYANSNQLTVLPDTIENLSSLTSLNLAGNQLTVLPDIIGNLGSLIDLQLMDNQFTSLPDSVGNLNTLRYLDLGGNQLTIIPETIGNLSSLIRLSFFGNRLTSLPESIGKLTLKGNIDIRGNYLPTDSVAQLKLKFPHLNFYHSNTRKLKLESKSISTKIDIEEISEWGMLNTSEVLMKYLAKDDRVPAHHYFLEEYSDNQGNPINLEDYVKDGKMLKTGSIYAKIRAGGTGVFPNNSDRAITNDTIEIEFYKRKLAFTSIPTTVSFGTDVAISANEKTYPLQAVGQPLAVQDNRKIKSTWTVSAKMTKELTSESNHVLTDSLLYRLNGNQFYLNTSSINLFSQQNTDDEPFAISDTWMKDEQNGLFLNIKAGQAFAETYTGTIEWDLQDVP